MEPTVETQSLTVKETCELIDGLTPVVVFVKRVAADGKVDANDIAHAKDLIAERDVILAGAEGISKVPAELKDLTVDELAQIGRATLAMIAKVRAG